MGCGAVCGSASAVIETHQQAQTHLRQLFKKMTPNKFLFPMQKFAVFAKQLQLNPRKFQLVLMDKLQPKSAVPAGVMEKWKIILFGLDSDSPAYINCLGYSQKKASRKSSLRIQAENHEEQPAGLNNLECGFETQIFQHKCFSQIEKDLDRTFSMPNYQKETFSLILRRIANHFPSMGYTQGINFIVGYLLVIGYSETDTFWMFKHIALNRRYMLLGLFEDGFPLSSVYIIIFRNLLKRYNSRLYSHLYQAVFVDESIWVFKWFITYYLYSFPLEMCQYIWDIVISVGGIGLVTFAVSLVNKLQSRLLQVEDPCQVSQFFQQLKDLNCFNSLINIVDVIRMAYSIKLQENDLEGLKNLKTSCGKSNIYAQYYAISLNQQIQKKTSSTNLDSIPQHFSITDPILFKKISIEKGQQILDKWYSKLTVERQKFRDTHRLRLAAGQTFQDIIDHNNSSNVISDNSEKQKKIQNIDLSKHSIIQEQDLEELDKFSSSYRQSFPIDHSAKVRPSSRRSELKKRVQQNEDIWDEEEQLQEKQDVMNLDDEFCYVPPKDLRFKRRKGFEKSHQILSQNSSKYRNKIMETTSRTNNSSMKFVAIGHSVLNNTHINNASRSSISSQANTQKENYSGAGTGRCCKCQANKNKNKTEQKQDTVKKSIVSSNNANVHEPEDSLEQMLAQNSKRKRVNTQHNWIANSHVYENKNNSLVKQPSDMGSEVQICNGKQMFKKKTRGRIQAVNTITDVNDINDIAEVCNYCEHRDGAHLHRLGFDQQSYDSIMIGNASSQKSSIMSCEVESVK